MLRSIFVTFVVILVGGAILDATHMDGGTGLVHALVQGEMAMFGAMADWLRNLLSWLIRQRSAGVETPVRLFF